MSDDEFDSELDVIIDSCLARQRDAKANAAREKDNDEKFYEAWNGHMATIVEPTLQEMAAKLQGKGMQAQVRRVSAHDTMGGVIPNTSGIAFYSSDVEARLEAWGYRAETSLSFTPMGRSIGVVFPRHRNEMLDMTKITREFVRQTAVAFLKEHVGPGARP